METYNRGYVKTLITTEITLYYYVTETLTEIMLKHKLS